MNITTTTHLPSIQSLYGYIYIFITNGADSECVIASKTTYVVCTRFSALASTQSCCGRPPTVHPHQELTAVIAREALTAVNPKCRCNPYAMTLSLYILIMTLPFCIDHDILKLSLHIICIIQIRGALPTNAAATNVC